MFGQDYSLKEFCAPNWNTTKVKSTCNMFEECISLKKLKLSNWILEHCDVYSMFLHCKALEELDISNWDLGKSLFPDDLFDDCKNSLKEINISNMDIEDIPWFSIMFYGLNKDCKIIFHHKSKFIDEFLNEHKKKTTEKNEKNKGETLPNPEKSSDYSDNLDEINYDETNKNYLDNE